MNQTVIGCDIGGANLKLSDGQAWSRHQPFALWQHPEQLVSELRNLTSEFFCQQKGNGIQPQSERWCPAITMTGELTDCFANKKEGVHFITDAVVAAFPHQDPSFYLTDGSFVNATTAKQKYQLAAASNWHALAQFVANNVGGETTNRQAGILVDVGSTTTDIIPFSKGQVIAYGHDDFGRLQNQELLYTAAIRTPIPGILQRVVHRGIDCPLMNEMFGTTLDTNIVLGHISEGSNSHYSADGKSTELKDCVRRLARFIGKDELTFDLNDARELARQVFDAQVKQIAASVANVALSHNFNDYFLVGSGQGDFYVDIVADKLDVELVQLSESIGDVGTSCATALAIANLARALYSANIVT